MFGSLLCLIAHETFSGMTKYSYLCRVLSRRLQQASLHSQ